MICSTLDEMEYYFCYLVIIQVFPEHSINGS